MYTNLCRCVHLNVLFFFIFFFSSLFAGKVMKMAIDAVTKCIENMSECVVSLGVFDACVCVKKIAKFINKNRYDKRFTSSGQHQTREKKRIGYHMNGKYTVCPELVQTRTCQVNNNGISSTSNGGGGSNPTTA